MPTLPAAGYQTDSLPEVQPTVNPPEGYRRVEAEPSAFGAGIGAGLTRLGDTEAKAALDRQDLYNKVSGDQQTNNYISEKTKILYGDPNVPGDTGFFGLHGQDAMEKFAETRDRLQNLRTQFGSSLNPIARLQYDSETRRLFAYDMALVGRHYDDQFQQYGVTTALSKQKLGADGVGQASASGDDNALTEALRQQYLGIQDEAKLKGLGQEFIDAKFADARANAVRSKVTAMEDRNPIGAMRFLDQNKDALKPDEYGTLMHRLHSAGDAIQANIYAGLTPAPSGWKARGTNEEATVGGVTSIAMTHSLAEQEQVAKTIATTDGLQHWAGVDPKTGKPWNPQLRLALQTAGLPVTGPITDVQWEQAKPLIKQYESGGGQNIRNFHFDATHTGGGPFQIVNSTWNAFAPRAFNTGPVTGLGGQSAAAPDQLIKTAGAGALPIPPPDFAAGQVSDDELTGFDKKIDEIHKNLDSAGLSQEEKLYWFPKAVQAARKEANAIYQEQQHQLKQHNEQLKAQSDAAEAQLQQRILTDQNAPTIAEIGSNKFLSPEAQRRQVALLERQNKLDPAAEVSKKNAMALVGAMALPDGNPNKLVSEQPIYDAYTSGNLTQADFKFAQSEFRNLHGPEGEQTKTKQEWIKAVTHKIQGPPGFSQFDPNAGVRLFNYQQWVDQKLKEAGPNWRDLFREDNKDYLGSDAALKPYMPGRAEVQNAADKAFQGAPAGPNLEALSKDELGAWARSQGTAEAFDKAYEIGVRKGFIAPNAPPQGSQAPVR